MCIHLGGDPARHDTQDLGAKAHEQGVDLIGRRLAPAGRHRVFKQGAVLRGACRLEDEGGVGGGVLRGVGLHGVKIAGVGHHGGQAPELLEGAHGMYDS